MTYDVRAENVSYQGENPTDDPKRLQILLPDRVVPVCFCHKLDRQTGREAGAGRRF